MATRTEGGGVRVFVAKIKDGMAGWRWSDGSLAVRIQWQIGLLVTAGILAMTAWSYFDTISLVRSRTLESLKQTLAVRSKFDSVHFERAQANTLDLRKEYLRRLEAAGDEDPKAEFEHWFERYPDGLIRVRQALDDHRYLPSVYIRKGVPLTAELRRHVWLAFDLLRSWGPALTMRYYSAYVDLPGIGLIMFSPSVNWGALADAQTNNFDYPPVRNSAPDRNPARRTLWSEVYFDDKADIYMVSAVTPVDLNGRWVASVSQDVAIDELTARALSEVWPAAYNMILDTEGRLLAHPQRMAEIRAAQGNLPVRTLADPLLDELQVALVNLHANLEPKTAPHEPEVRMSADGQFLLGMAHITGPAWHFVTVYPYAEVEKVALANARGVILVGALVLFAGLVVSTAILRWQVGRPLRDLIRASEALEAGRYNTRVRSGGRHELGRLAQTFNRMSQSIEDRDQRLKQLAQVDTLTGLANRYHLLERLQRAIQQAASRAGSFGLIFLDLDRFKTVNDTLGHSMGDELLRRVAALLLKQARPGDLVARLGGDEFVILVESGPEPRLAAEQISRRLIAALRVPFEVAGQQLRTSPSIGISIYPDDATDAENLVRQADVAMYRAKAEGRNGFVFFDPQTDEPTPAVLGLNSALHTALEQGEFVLFFQPKVDLHSRALVGCEALIRWERPGQGLMLPTEFLPQLQEIGLMRELNEWVLSAVCRQLGQWQAQGLEPLPVAVNLTPGFCKLPGLCSLVRQHCERHGVPMHWLEVEITEGALLEENLTVMTNLRELRQAGVRIAIDDFGTGYSALSYLHRFEIDTLKIDRSFVLLLGGRQSETPMTRAITLIGHSLGIGVIAEGVETEEQAEALASHGCGQAQGYLFGAPEAAVDFAQRLRPSAPRAPHLGHSAG